mmetsp:Transcript_18968/g.13756  ORF Transcript_18968/g.13756 Transcript_18968/m.13756 type:complete len:96 (+) Transcript_18968:1124-1411(+)
MFSFQVHEKQITSPLLFFSLLPLFPRSHFSAWQSSFSLVCSFSMAALFLKDHSLPSYLALTIGFFYLSKVVEGLQLGNGALPKQKILQWIFVYED